MPDDTSPHLPPSILSNLTPESGTVRGDEVVSLLTDFENSVDALKKLCAGKSKSGVPAASAAVERAEADRRQIAELRASLESLRTELAHRSTDLDQRSADIERLRHDLTQELHQQREHAACLAEEARERDAAMIRREEALAARLTAFELESETVQKEKARLTLLSDPADSRRAQLELLQAGIDSKLREVERREQALEQRVNSGAADARIAELNARLIDAQSLAEIKSGELAEFRRLNQEAQASIAALQQQLTQPQSIPVAPASFTPDPNEIQARQRLEELLVETRNELDAANAQTVEHKNRAQQLEASLDDMRRQTVRVTDTTLELHEQNDALKQELEQARHSLEESARAAHLAQIQETEQARRLDSAGATIAELQSRLKERPDLDPIRAQIREEIEAELQAPIARAAQRADAAEFALLSAHEELTAVRTRLTHESGQHAATQARLVEAARTLAERDELIASHVAEQVRLSSEVAACEQKLRVEQERAAQAARTIESQSAELAELRGRASTLERSFNDARDASLRNESLAQRQAEELADAQARLAQAEASSRELRAQIDSVDSRSEADHHTIASLEHDLSAARVHLENMRGQQAAAQAALDECRVRFESERIALQTALGEASAEREQITLQNSAAARTLAEKVERMESLEASLHAASAASAQAEAVRLENSRLTARLRDAMGVAESAAARIRELESIVQTSQDQVAILEARMTEAAASAPASADAQALRAKLELLKDRLRSEIEARDVDAARIEELQTRLAANQGARSDSLPAGRLKRLKAHRRLRRDQTTKLRNLGDALRSRFEICEQIISQRAQLAAAHQLVTETQRKVQTKQASSRVVVVSFFGTMTILILSFLSWAAAGQFFPGRYAARVTIEADGRGREIPIVELQEWQKFHENLIVSPAFTEKVADHMKKFGIMSLSAPGAVAERLKEDLSFESAKPGQLVLELRGDGAARTARELNAISTRFAAEAQELRNRRNDGAITSITKPSEALPDPIDNSRMVAAIGLLGGSVALASLISYLVYRKLVSAKSKFENEIALDALLDSKRWPDPTLGMENARKAA